MGKLSERTTQCKPLIAQLKTAAAHRKHARFLIRPRIISELATMGFFGISDIDSRSFRACARSLFSDSEDTTQSPSDCSIAETIKLPLVRLESPRRYREIRPRCPSTSKHVDKRARDLSYNGISDCRIKLGVNVESNGK